MRFAPTVASVYDVHCGEKDNLEPGARPQLRDAALRGTGFAEDLPATYCDLVGSDHDRIRGWGCYCFGLEPRESTRERLGALAGQGRLVAAWRLAFEAQSQPFQELAPVDRGRGENQAALGGIAQSVLHRARGSLKNKDLNANRL
jgi:hypothetical protein